jgi:hypothetical protein
MQGLLIETGAIISGAGHCLPQSALGPVAQRDVAPVFTDYGAGDREAKTDPARIAAA